MNTQAPNIKGMRALQKGFLPSLERFSCDGATLEEVASIRATVRARELWEALGGRRATYTARERRVFGLASRFELEGEDARFGASALGAEGPCQSLDQVRNGTRNEGVPHAQADRSNRGQGLRGDAPSPGGLPANPDGTLPDAEFARILRPGDRRAGAVPAEGAGRAGALGKPFHATSPARCQSNDWCMSFASKSTGEWALAPFRCHSWRCTRCAPRVNARDSQRIEKALGSVKLDELVFVTLTFDRSRYRDAREAWEHCGEAWTALRARLAYVLGQGEGRERRKAKLTWVQTWEQHGDGWPHVHALVHCRELAEDVRKQGSYQRPDQRTGEPRPIWRWVRNTLRPAALRAGFGPIMDLQFPRRAAGALAGYLVKIAAELTGSAKRSQTPLAAPRGFRRIRATPKFLDPARKSSGEYTGGLLTAPLDLVADELERGAESFLAAAQRALNLLASPPWQRRKRVPNAARCSIPEASLSTA